MTALAPSPSALPERVETVTRRERLAVATVAALAIGVPVAVVLRAFDLYGALAAVIAHAATWLTVLFAVRRPGLDGEWVAVLFLGMVLPPVAVFAPTGLGALIAFGAGLLSFAVLLPFVIFARRLPRIADAPRRRRHLTLLGAIWLAVGALMTVMAALADA